MITVKQAIRPDSSTTRLDKTFLDQLHHKKYVKQQLSHDPIVYLSKTLQQKDTIYFHEAVKQEDAPKFIKAIVKEVNSHIMNKH